jgi:hypothetical protein
MNHSPKRIILGILILLTLGVVYGTATHRWFAQGASSVATSQSSGGERKPIYWYDAMNPQHHYNQPGKAPDGMDLVPQDAKPTAIPTDQKADAPAADTNKMAGMPAKDSERKILYWYDPMHPAYTSDKPGIAPDCGMALVPKYADDQAMARMPSGTITISPEKQVLAGVRTAIV